MQSLLKFDAELATPWRDAWGLSSRSRQRSGRNLGACLGIYLALLFLPLTAQATTVLRAPVSELVQASDVVFHGVIRAVDDELATTPRGPFRTAIEFEVLEVFKGLKPTHEIFNMVLPGGRAFGRTMRIPGMPSFVEGQEVIVLLERTSGGYALTGLGQGFFSVLRGDFGALVKRDLQGMEFVYRKGGAAGAPEVQGALGEASPALDDFLVALRLWTAEPLPQPSHEPSTDSVVRGAP